MKPPAGLPSTLIALGEAFAHESGIDPGDLWAYLYRKKPTPTAVRDSIVAAFFPRVAPGDFLSLTSTHGPNTVAVMSSTALSSNALRSQAQITDEVRDHRFVKAMAKRGLTFAEVAAALGEELGRKVPRSSLLSWVKPKGDIAARGIPADAADALERLYGVPVSAWRRVIPRA